MITPKYSRKKKSSYYFGLRRPRKVAEPWAPGNLNRALHTRFSSEQQKILQLYERQIPALNTCDQECPKLSFILQKCDAGKRFY